MKRVKECYEVLINDKYKIKNINIMKEKYEIEIHDMTAKGIYVYINESTSFYNAFLTAKEIQRVYENS